MGNRLWTTTILPGSVDNKQDLITAVNIQEIPILAALNGSKILRVHGGSLVFTGKLKHVFFWGDRGRFFIVLPYLWCGRAVFYAFCHDHESASFVAPYLPKSGGDRHSFSGVLTYLLCGTAVLHGFFNDYEGASFLAGYLQQCRQMIAPRTPPFYYSR